MCQEETHDDGKAASSAYRLSTADVQAFRGTLQSGQAVEDKLAAHQTRMEQTSAAPEPEEEVVEQDAEQSEEEDQDMDFTELAAAGKPCSSRGAPKPKRAPKTKAVPKKAPSVAGSRAGSEKSAVLDVFSEAGSPRRGRAKRDSEEAFAAPPLSVGPLVDTGVTMKPPSVAAKPGVVKKAQELLVAKKQMFSDTVLWQGKVKKRSLDQGVSSMESQAGKLLGDESQRQLMDEMLDFVEWAPKKFSLLSNLRKSPAEYLASLSEEDRACLRKLDSSLVGTVVLQTATGLAKDLEQDTSSLRCSLVMLGYSAQGLAIAMFFA